MVANADPSTPSAEHKRLAEVSQMIDDILVGPEAVKTAGRSKTYLPKFVKETEPNYRRRLSEAPWRPEFADILQALCSKPFNEDIEIKAGASSRIRDLVEDIDTLGSSVTSFARQVFRGGVAKSRHGILIDYPTMAPGLTLADEKEAGARPLWLSVRSEDILALNTRFVGGRRIVDHLRLLETATERDGYDEIAVSRVRVLEPTSWEVWEKRGTDKAYRRIDGGDLTLGEVPFVLFKTGPRPPLESLAAMQIELFQLLSGQKENMTKSAFPMIKIIGAAMEGELVVGPGCTISVPAAMEGVTPDAAWMSPDPDILRIGDEHIELVTTAMRRLGMQPMTRQSGNVTATESSIEGAKAHSVVEAWALDLKDALEQAFVFTSRWLGEEPGVEVGISTDFSVEPYAQAPLDALAKARAAKDISQRTYWAGLRRFDVLAPDFDPDAEELALALESPSDDTEDDLLAAQPA